MLDANAFILLLTGDAAVVARAGACARGDLVVSSIAFAEVARGAALGKPPSPDVLERTEAIIPVMPFGTAAAHAYARLPFRRGSFDRLIAAHALALDLVLVTADLGNFTDVPGLRLENWTRP